MKKIILVGLALFLAVGAASANSSPRKGSMRHNAPAARQPASSNKAAMMYGRGGLRPAGINRLNPQPLPP